MAHDVVSVLEDGAAGEPRFRDPPEAAVAVEGVARQVEGLESLDRKGEGSYQSNQIQTGEHFGDWIGNLRETNCPGKGATILTMG